MALNKVLLLSPLAVVAYDLAASLASSALGFPYGRALVGSVLVYAASGFFAWSVGGFASSVLVGAIAGLTDATFGLAVSWALGPGRPPNGTLSFKQWLGVAGSVVILAIVCAAIGGLTARLVAPRVNA